MCMYIYIKCNHENDVPSVITAMASYHLLIAGTSEPKIDQQARQGA